MKQIYFDSDEEITAIINKLESIESDRIALIPPKRSTTLQSVVNLKLIQKAVTANDNELVLITKDPFILNIASQLKILAAPNLATDPEVPQSTEGRTDMPGTVIEGSEASEKDFTDADKAAEAVEPDAEEAEKPKKSRKTPKSKTNQKVPDFDRFKKYILLGAAAVLLLGALLWWALVMAPHATVRIEGVTRDVHAETDFTLDPEADEPDLEQRTLAADVRQESRTLSTQFKPTGTDTVGEKATGEITIYNDCYNTEDPVEIEKGTAITSDEGLVFRNDVSFEIEPASVFLGDCERTSETAAVTADKIGEEYNTGPTSFTVEGYPSGENGVNGKSSNKMTGGGSEEVSVPAKDDIQKARQELLDEKRSSVKTSLRKQFNDNQYIIDASFSQDVTQLNSEPPAGERADGDARLILQVTYTLLAVPQEDMEALLEHVYQQQVEGGQEMGMIENGLDEAEIERNESEAISFTLRSDGVLGPDIPEEELKNEIAGKSYGETIEFIEAKPNVTTVKVNLSPLWVTSVPDDHDKIEVTFEVADPDDDDTRD